MELENGRDLLWVAGETITGLSEHFFIVTVLCENITVDRAPPSHGSHSVGILLFHPAAVVRAD